MKWDARPIIAAEINISYHRPSGMILRYFLFFWSKNVPVFLMYTSWNVCMSSRENVGVTEHRVSWIQHNAYCVLLRDRTEEQSFQCGFHPHIHIIPPRAQQICPSSIFDDCFGSLTLLWSLSGCVFWEENWFCRSTSMTRYRVNC